MLQAPQSPDEQPSFEPVRPKGPRNASSMVSFGSQRNSTGSPLMVVETCSLAMISMSSGAPGGDGNGASQQHTGHFGPIGNGAALVVDRTAGCRAGRGCGSGRRIVELAADQCLRGLFDQQ